MNVYLWLKTFHVVAMIAWTGTMLAVPPIVRALSSRHADAAAIAAARRLYSRLGTPAMLTAIGLGLILAQQSGAFRTSWLQIKLLLVFVLAGVHGAIAGQMRRAEGRAASLRALSVLPALVAILLLAIVALAVLKPA